MARVSTRRPLPALIVLLALSVFAALVWVRVWNRDSSDGNVSKPSKTCAVAPTVALPAPNAVTLSVLNATARAGLAKAVGDQLATRGFIIANVGNEDTTISSVSEIRFGPQGKTGATLVSYYLPGSTLVPTDQADGTVIVVVGDGYKSTIASQEDVAKAIAAAAVEATKVPTKPATTPATPAAASTPAAGTTSTVKPTASC